jgi:hypothetical protein
MKQRAQAHREETYGRQHYHGRNLNHLETEYGLCDQVGVRWPTFLSEEINGEGCFKGFGRLWWELQTNE